MGPRSGGRESIAYYRVIRGQPLNRYDCLTQNQSYDPANPFAPIIHVYRINRYDCRKQNQSYGR